MNVYAHATREAKRTFARLLDKVVGGEQKFALVWARKGKNKGRKQIAFLFNNCFTANNMSNYRSVFELSKQTQFNNAITVP